MTEYEYITIRNFGPSKSGKTETFDVISKKRSYVIGQIRWFGRWRQYAFEPAAETVYSTGCLRDIADFIERQMELWRESKRD